MDSLVITPCNKKELLFVKELMEKMNIHSRILSQEENEDIGLALLMKDVDRTDKVDKEHILRKLSNEY